MPGLEKRCQGTNLTLARAFFHLGRVSGIGRHDSVENWNVRSRWIRYLWGSRQACHGSIQTYRIAPEHPDGSHRGIQTYHTHSITQTSTAQSSAQKNPAVRCPPPRRAHRRVHVPGVVLVEKVPHDSRAQRDLAGVGIRLRFAGLGYNWAVEASEENMCPAVSDQRSRS